MPIGSTHEERLIAQITYCPSQRSNMIYSKFKHLFKEDCFAMCYLSRNRYASMVQQYDSTDNVYIVNDILLNRL